MMIPVVVFMLVSVGGPGAARFWVAEILDLAILGVMGYLTYQEMSQLDAGARHDDRDFACFSLECHLRLGDAADAVILEACGPERNKKSGELAPSA